VSNAATRSGEATYEFISDAFNPKFNPVQTRSSDFEEDVEATDNDGHYVPAGKIDQVVKDAWNEFKSVPNQNYYRDYIYYGINQSNNPGTLNHNVRECLYKFRVDYDKYSQIADQNGLDPALQTTSIEKRYMTPQEIIKGVWTDGKFEFIFTALNTSTPIIRGITLAGTDVFSISKVHVHHRNSTAFRRSKNTYTVDPANLRSKWIYPEKHGLNQKLLLTPWRLDQMPLTFYILVEEKDAAQATTKTYTKTEQRASSTNFGLDLGGNNLPINTVFKIGYGITNTTVNIMTKTIATTTGSENLGTLECYFYDAIIKNDTYKNTKGYEMYTVNNGMVEAMFIPTVN
jgi:hypothetical protein